MLYAATPSLVEVIAWATTIGAGLGAGIGAAIGTGRVIYLRRVTPARIEAEKAFDDAHRETTLAQLEHCVESKTRHEQRIKDLVEGYERLKEEVSTVRYDLEQSRAREEKVIMDQMAFARDLMTVRDYLQAEHEQHAAPPVLETDPDGVDAA
jgi:molecular chaperone GrpE (heat shock protein)